MMTQRSLWCSTAAVSVFAVILSAQESRPRFEVASVKPVPVNSGLASYWDMLPNGIALQSMSLGEIILIAYDLPSSGRRIVGGPPALIAANFTINAKATDLVRPIQIRAMLRALLADRFKLRAHTETRDRQVFMLTRIRSDTLGPDLQPSKTAECVPFLQSADNLAARALGATTPRCPTRVGMDASRVVTKVGTGTIADLIAWLREDTTRPIVDGTGLRGLFDWRLRYQAELSDGPVEIPAPFMRALRDQLGLRLESRTAPVEVLVIEHIEQPQPD